MYVNTSPVACTGLANTDLSRGRLVCSADVDSRSDDLSGMLASLPFRQYAWDRPAFRQLYRVDGAPSLEGTSTHAPTHAPTGIALGECSRAIEALGERPRTVTGPSEATNLRVATASFISALQSRVQSRVRSRALHAGVLLPPPRRRLTAAVGPPKPGIILAWPGAMCQSPGYRTRCQRSSVGTLRIPFGT